MSAPNKIALMYALLDPANRSLAQAAQAAGINEKTARRWRREPDFVAQLDVAQAAAVDELTGRLVATLPHVEAVFLEVMNDRSNTAGVRVRAASELADLTLRLFEVRTLERRITELEAATWQVDL